MKTRSQKIATKVIKVIFLLSLNLVLSQKNKTENIYIKINENQKNNSSITKWVENKDIGLNITVFKKNTDSIVFNIFDYKKNKICIKKNKTENFKIIDLESLMKLNIVEFLNLFENKTIYLLEDIKNNFYYYKINSYSYYERPQD